MLTQAQVELLAQLQGLVGQDLDIASQVNGRQVGGEGKLIDVSFDGTDIWVDVDWGYSWIVRPENVAIRILPSAL